MMVGLRAANLPTLMESEFLIAFAVRNFGSNTLGEVSLAFELAIGRRLEIRSEDVICYENFTVEYFGRIMAAYRSWANPRAAQVHSHKALEKAHAAEVDQLRRREINHEYMIYLHKILTKKLSERLRSPLTLDLKRRHKPPSQAFLDRLNPNPPQ